MKKKVKSLRKEFGKELEKIADKITNSEVENTKNDKNKKRSLRRAFLTKNITNKRGTRVKEFQRCFLCEEPASYGYEYKIENDYYFLCPKCKASFRKPYTKIVFTPFGGQA